MDDDPVMGSIWEVAMEGDMAIFSKRHYEAIADVLVSTRPSKQANASWEQWVAVSVRFMTDLRIDSAKFDQRKFMAAIGLEIGD